MKSSKQLKFESRYFPLENNMLCIKKYYFLLGSQFSYRFSPLRSHVSCMSTSCPRKKQQKFCYLVLNCVQQIWRQNTYDIARMLSFRNNIEQILSNLLFTKVAFVLKISQKEIHNETESLITWLYISTNEILEIDLLSGIQL